jgi:hypothetical protein
MRLQLVLRMTYNPLSESFHLQCSAFGVGGLVIVLASSLNPRRSPSLSRCVLEFDRFAERSNMEGTENMNSSRRELPRVTSCRDVYKSGIVITRMMVEEESS